MCSANKKINILYGLEAADAGALKHLVYLVTHLDKALFEITVILSPRKSNKLDEELQAMRSHGAKVITLPMQRSIHPLKDPLALYRIYTHLSKNHYDIVHAHSSKAGVLFRVAAWLKGSSIILYTPHCFYFQSKTGLARQFFSWIERLMNRITTRLIISQNERLSTISNHIAPAEKIIAVNNAIDTNDYRLDGNPAEIKSKFNIPLQNIVIGAIGRLTAQKDWVTYIHAAHQAVKKHPNLTFLIVGDGELQDDLQQLIHQLQLQNHVLVTGYISNISEVYSMIDIFVSTSLWEGLPYVLLEAMWFKKPIIASNLGYDGVLYHNENSLLVKYGSPYEFATAITTLLSNEELMKKIGETGHQFIHAHFKFEHFVQHHQLWYQSLTKRS